MADTVVVEADENTGFRFSWGLAIAGAVVATAVTFFLLTLGSGFGLLLVNPMRHGGTPTGFLTGGAIYFLAAQAFGFAVGGHLAGRLLGPLVESRIQEDVRAGAHGLAVWAVTVVATTVLVMFGGLAADGAGRTMSALYGAGLPHGSGVGSLAYEVDVLFRPEERAGTRASGMESPAQSAAGDGSPRAEAARILLAGPMHGDPLTADDRTRLIILVSEEARIPYAAATDRVDRVQGDIAQRARQAADAARKAASYASLWIAFSLLFGAIAAIFAAVSARLEDDREAARF